MTAKEALEIIKVAQMEVEWDYPMDYFIAFAEAINALDKQNPQKPCTNTIHYPYIPDLTTVFCPSCSRRLRTNRTQKQGDKFCPNCGQAIDWSGISEKCLVVDIPTGDK